MNPFAVIFYSSLVVTVALLWAEERRLAKRSPEVFQSLTAHEPWFVFDIVKGEQTFLTWYRRTIKPTLVRFSLRVLKKTQTGLQLMRRTVRRHVERLSTLDDEHRKNRHNRDFFQKFHPSHHRG